MEWAVSPGRHVPLRNSRRETGAARHKRVGKPRAGSRHLLELRKLHEYWGFRDAIVDADAARCSSATSRDAHFSGVKLWLN